MKLYLTADAIGTPSGGGVVTKNELRALSELDEMPTLVLARNYVEEEIPHDPFEQDRWFLNKVKDCNILKESRDNAIWGSLTHVHCYAGCLTETIKYLKTIPDVKVSYTAAAHSIEDSRKEHLKCGHLVFPYPHLTDPELWKQYVGGYLLADLIICPSTYSKQTMEGYGYTGPIKVVPHGCNPPEVVKQLPNNFTVGYLGAYGVDKGVRYLLQAWGELDYQDESRLLLGGRDSINPFVVSLVNQYVKRPWTVGLQGWVEDVADFYNSTSLYVQPSVTEGFGIEVLEAMSFGRPVVCSMGAGAYDLVADTGAGFEVYHRDEAYVQRLADTINMCKSNPDLWKVWGSKGRENAADYTWDIIRKRYQDVWKELIG